MKKAALVIAILCVAAFGAFAQDAGQPHAAVGDLTAGGGVNFGWSGFGLGGGVEYMLARWDIPNFAPLTFGAAGRVSLYIGSSMQVDIAALGTAHFGLKTFTSLPAFLQPLDWYYGLGLGFGIGNWGGIGFATGSGICYYLTPTLAITSDYFYTNYFGVGSGSSGTLGVKLKL